MVRVRKGRVCVRQVFMTVGVRIPDAIINGMRVVWVMVFSMAVVAAVEAVH